MNTRLRLTSHSSDDARFKVSNKVQDVSGNQYTILIDRDLMRAEIIDANGVIISQIAGNGSMPQMLQAIKNELINTLSCSFAGDNVSRDSGGLSAEVPVEIVLSFSNVPTSGSFALTYEGVTSAAVSLIADLQAALRVNPALAECVVTGSYAADVSILLSGDPTPTAITEASNSLQIDAQNHIAFGATPTAGTFKITNAGHDTSNLAHNASALNVRDALRALSGLSQVTVTGSVAAGFTATMVGVTSPTIVTTSSLTQPEAITPSVVKQDEKILTTFSDIADAGTFKFTYNSNDTSDLAFDADAAAVQAALRLVAGLSTAVVTGDMTVGFMVTMVGMPSPLALTCTSSLTIALAPITALVVVQDRENVLTFNHTPDAGTFKLTYAAQDTSNIAYNANSTAVQTALRLVTGLENVTVSGSMGAGFTIVMVGIVGPTALTATSSLTRAIAVSVTDTQPVAREAITIIIA